MVYTVKYKCYSFETSCGDLIALHIKYRQHGKLRWTVIHTELWSFAMRIWSHEYNVIPMMSGIYENLCLFQQIIDERYDGSMDRYVEEIVKYDILQNRAENADRKAAEDIFLRFATNGWKTQTIEVEDKR